MIKKSLLFFTLIISGCFNLVFGKPVTPQTAQTVALNFFIATVNPTYSGTLSAVLNYTKTDSAGNVDFYVFDIHPVTGFVIVSAEDNAKPVIGYSSESYFNSNVSNLQPWMNKTALKISAIVKQQVQADANITALWSDYIKGAKPPVTRGGGVGPLLTTTWDQESEVQGSSVFTYNALCPMNTNQDERALTGCVATAMAQIMRFWNFPVQGKGSYSYDAIDEQDGYNYGTQSANFGITNYDWEEMPASLSISSTSQQITAVATLMYQCGVSVAMNYGDDEEGGSGAWVLSSDTYPGQPNCAQYSYVNYFSYNPHTLEGVHYYNYSDSAWISLMENEINDGRVVQYVGTDPQAGGHTWVMDGYNSTGMLHMNWGWSGLSDGYYDVSNLNPDGYVFSEDDEALIGIEPLTNVNVVAQIAKTAICTGDTTQLSATGPKSATYSWSPATGLECASCATTKAFPTAPTTYVVTADSSGIKGSYAVFLDVTTTVTSGFNATSTTACSTPAPVSFKNISTNSTSYLWNFGDDSTSTDVAPVHNYTSFGNFTVTLQSTGPCGVSSSVQNNLVQINDITPIANSVNICEGEKATLIASAPAGTLSWYQTSSIGTPDIDTGSQYITPALDGPITYYVQSEIIAPVKACSPASNNFGTGGYFTSTYYSHGIIFNCTAPQTLISVVMYAQNAGDRLVSLYNASGTLLQSATVYLTTGQSTVTLDFSLPVADSLSLTLGGNNQTTDVYRNNSGAQYPYYSTDSTVVLVNSDVAAIGDPGYYYYFYDWKLQAASCISNRIPVHVSVFGYNNSFTTKANSLSVGFNPSDTGAVSYKWYFGDGSTSTQQNPSHTYSASAEYTVSLVESNGTCDDSIVKVVNVVATGVANISASVAAMNLAPNPVNSNLQVHISSPWVANNYNLTVYNILGETLINKTVFVNNGDNLLNMDVSGFASGIYFVRLTGSDGAVLTKKFVKD